MLTSIYVSLVWKHGNVKDRSHSWKTISEDDYICEDCCYCKSPRCASKSSQVDHYARCSRNFVFPSNIPGAHFVLRRAGETHSIHRWFPGVPLYTSDYAKLPNGISSSEVEHYSPVCWFIAIINIRIILHDTYDLKTDVKIRFQYCCLKQI